MSELQDSVFDALKDEDAIPHMFKIWEGFPSAHSGKRNLMLIKTNIDNLIEI